MIDDEDLQVALRVLEEAASLDADDSAVQALERAAAGLRKRARGQRRAKRREQRKAKDRAVLASAGLHQEALRPGLLAAAGEVAEDERVLHRMRGCYVCKARFREVHHRYHSLCPECAGLNEEMREARCDMTGRRALVTGGRIKIGFEVALKMLRDGATVHLTSRFPRDAARRFSEVADSSDWLGRVRVHGVDLRDVRQLAQLIATLEDAGPFDVLVHNAAQTVRRPPAYSRGLASAELEDPERPSDRFVMRHGGRRAEGAQALIPADAGWLMQAAEALDEEGMFPDGALDIEGKQLDLRPKNTWRMLLDEVHPVELMEVWMVNAFAPFVLNARLKSSLVASPFEDRYIVNVSAVEGQFAFANKTAHHPHTNMAKAALNMMTRTSAQEYATHGISMTAVDTGWITDEHAEPARQLRRDSGWRPPLDVIDGAARVYHPIVRGIAHDEYLQGVFLKDYEVAPW